MPSIFSLVVVGDIKLKQNVVYPLIFVSGISMKLYWFWLCILAIIQKLLILCS